MANDPLKTNAGETQEPVIPELDADLDVIQKLDDEPNDVGGLSPAQLKAEFDKAGNLIKGYLNRDLIPALLALVKEMETDADGRYLIRDEFGRVSRLLVNGSAGGVMSRPIDITNNGISMQKNDKYGNDFQIIAGSTTSPLAIQLLATHGPIGEASKSEIYLRPVDGLAFGHEAPTTPDTGEDSRLVSVSIQILGGSTGTPGIFLYKITNIKKKNGAGEEVTESISEPVRIYGVAAPLSDGEAVNKAYVDGEVAKYLPLDGGTMTGELKVRAPVEDMSAANKKYVDDHAGLSQEAADGRYLKLSGGELEAGAVVRAAASQTPTQDDQLVAKKYVDDNKGMTETQGDARYLKLTGGTIQESPDSMAGYVDISPGMLEILSADENYQFLADGERITFLNNFEDVEASIRVDKDGLTIEGNTPIVSLFVKGIKTIEDVDPSDPQYSNQGRFAASVEYVRNSIASAVGDINTILDSINGEVV